MSVSVSTLCVFFVVVHIINPCLSQLCNNVTSPTEGKVTCSEDNTLLVCTAVCNKGYEFRTFTQVERRYCVKTTGQWVNGNQLPPCIPYVQNMCSSIEPPNQGVVRCENVNSQLVCNAKCNTGYMFESQELEVERTCDVTNGLWINGREFPNCIRNDTRCSSPVAPAHGLVNCDRNSSTVHCVALCQSGYEFSTGERFIERSCDLYNGSWNGVNVDYPKCVVKKTPDVGKCSSLPAKQHTSITCKHNGIDLICSAVCDKGYGFETNDVSVVRVCDDVTGMWLNGRKIPDCVLPCNRYIISGNHNIGNNAFSASSIYNTAQLVAGADRVRIETVSQNTNINVRIAGGWRPAVDNLNQFIQIDMGKKMEFYGIATRGRDASNEYVKRFRVLYSSDGRHFIPYGDDKVQDRFFEGNSDSGSVVINRFSCPFEARFVRVNPLEWNQHIGLRLDFLGCEVHEGGPSVAPSTTLQPSMASQTNSGSTTASSASSVKPPATCLPLLPPVSGIVSCEQSEKQLVCTALCKDGFVFDSGEAIIKRSCDTATGSWLTGTTYPECKAYKGALTTSPVNKLPHKCVGRVADCKILPNGDFQTCGDCHFYASCSEGYIYVRPCPVNLVFDSIAQRCLYTSSTCIHKPPIIGRK